MSTGVVRVTAITDPQRCGLGYPVLIHLICENNAVTAVAERLVDRPDVRFLALTTGPFDIVAELVVSSSAQLAAVLLEELARIPGIRRTSTEVVLRKFKVSYDWSQVLLSRTAQPANMERDQETVAPVNIDRTDRDLLDSLRSDGRRSCQELASDLGISESAARRRLEFLVSTGCTQPTTVVHPRFLGFDVEIFAWLQVDLSRIDEAAAALAMRPEVHYLAGTSGYSDLIAEVVLRSQDDLYRFRTEILGSLPGLRHAEIALELHTLKRGWLKISPISEVV
jgi:DNA-binding Lrp family transcriptional regulator